MHPDEINTTESTMNKSGLTSSTATTSGQTLDSLDENQASASQSPPQCDLKQSILQKGGELEIIDSDSDDEDGSCATRSKHNKSIRSSLNMDSPVPIKYNEVFHSHQHPMFQTTASVDDENDDNFLLFTKRSKGKPAKRWGLVGKAIGQERSISVGRREMKKEYKAGGKSKERVRHGEVAQDVQTRSGRSKLLRRQLQKKMSAEHLVQQETKQEHLAAKQHKL